MIYSRISLVLLTAATLAVALPSLALAQGSLEGDWKLALGKKAPCAVSMSADGAVTAAADCPVNVARWKGTSNGVQLQTASGETFAVLKARDGAFQGTTFADARTVTLSR
jgi:hypothetical protein